MRALLVFIFSIILFVACRKSGPEANPAIDTPEQKVYKLTIKTANAAEFADRVKWDIADINTGQYIFREDSTLAKDSGQTITKPRYDTTFTINPPIDLLVNITNKQGGNGYAKTVVLLNGKEIANNKGQIRIRINKD